MQDLRVSVTDKIIEHLTEKAFDYDQLQTVSNIVTTVLSDYEITERNTEIMVRSDKNNKILKRYIACLKVDGKSENTIKLYYTRLQHFSNFLDIPFDDVGTYDIRFYLASMKENGVSNRTLENYRSYISAFYEWLMREEIINKNPCSKIQPIKYKEEVRYPFSDTEIDELRTACVNERERSIIELLLTSGVRVNELVNLNIDDIDFSNLSIHIKNGKGSKERISYITNVCAIHLKKYLSDRTDSNHSLFISLKSKDRITTGGVRNLLKRIGKRSTVENIHPHRFRRTFASHLSKRGMDVQTIAKLMGHSNVQTTMVYIAMDKSKLLESYKTHIL